MTKGEVSYAIRKAQGLFDEWNDVTGAISKRNSWYFEVLAVIEDAVRIGALVACQGIEADLSEITDKYK